MPLFHQHIALGDPAAAFAAYATGGAAKALGATTLKIVIDATGHAVVTRLEPSHDTIIDTQGAGDHATQFVKTRASAEQISQIADPLTEATVLKFPDKFASTPGKVSTKP